MSKLMHLVLARGYIGRSMRNLGNKKVQGGDLSSLGMIKGMWGYSSLICKTRGVV